MNSYEASEVFNVGNAHEVILGQKVVDPTSQDNELGQGFRTIEADIDESDE
jgi:hypothetical protein